MRSLREVLQAHHLQPRVAAARLELHLDFYSYIYILRPIDLTTKIYRDNILCVWLYSLIFEVVLVRPRAHEVVARTKWWGTVYVIVAWQSLTLLKPKAANDHSKLPRASLHISLQ